jgi:histidine triad (HIT) family protein
MANSCIFCKIIKGEIPASKIYENASTVAFLDIAPVNPGHTLVVPKLHFETLLDIPDVQLAELFKVVKKISPLIMSAVGAQGFNIGINNFRAAGQLVPHFHVHIMPRFENDGRELWVGNKYKAGEAEKVAEKIRSLLK